MILRNLESVSNIYIPIYKIWLRLQNLIKEVLPKLWLALDLLAVIYKPFFSHFSLCGVAFGFLLGIENTATVRFIIYVLYLFQDNKYFSNNKMLNQKYETVCSML